MAGIRSRIACVLAECGFPEAAHACVPRHPDPDTLRPEIEHIVRSVMDSLKGTL